MRLKNTSVNGITLYVSDEMEIIIIGVIILVGCIIIGYKAQQDIIKNREKND